MRTAHGAVYLKRFGVALLPLLLAAQTRTVTDEEVRRVHNSTLLIDSHNDVTSRTVDGFDIGERASDGQTDLPRMREGGIGAQFFAVYVGADYVKDNHSARRTLEIQKTTPKATLDDLVDH